MRCWDLCESIGNLGQSPDGFRVRMNWNGLGLETGNYAGRHPGRREACKREIG